MIVTREQVLEIVRTTNERTTQELVNRIEEISLALGSLQPPNVEPYLPVSINPAIAPCNSSLDLIKSLPEFSGEASSYPTWRSAANFANNYYYEGSEKYYLAIGILRNKIIGTANLTLSSLNTVLNLKSIIARLDQTYADKRPIYVLENEMSILRQGDLSITDYYNKHLTLIIYKQIMTHEENNKIIEAFNERARENALRIFISSLRRSLCNILFSSRPKDLPTALAVAQELETNNKRYNFAHTFAMGNSINPSRSTPIMPYRGQLTAPNSHSIPMEIDRKTSIHRHPLNKDPNQIQSHKVNPAYANNQQQQL